MPFLTRCPAPSTRKWLEDPPSCPGRRHLQSCSNMKLSKQPREWPLPVECVLNANRSQRPFPATDSTFCNPQSIDRGLLDPRPRHSQRLTRPTRLVTLTTPPTLRIGGVCAYRQSLRRGSYSMILPTTSRILDRGMRPLFARLYDLACRVGRVDNLTCLR